MKKKGQTTKALLALGQKRANDSDDESYTSSKVSSAKSINKKHLLPSGVAKAEVYKKKHMSKKKLPSKEEIPKANRVSQYLTPEVTYCSKVSTSVSTINSTVSALASSHSTTSSSVQTNNYCNQLSFSASFTPDKNRAGTCHGCRNVFNCCLNRKYCDLSLQAVLNHIDEAGGFCCVSDLSVTKAYHNEYMSQVRYNLKAQTGFYESNQMLDLPRCMMTRSLRDDQVMASSEGKILQITYINREYTVLPNAKNRLMKRQLLWKAQKN